MKRECVLLVVLVVSLPGPSLLAAESEWGRAAALNCLTCHHPGLGENPQIPALSELQSSDIASALRDFRDGRKPATIMDRISASLSDAQIEAVARELQDLLR